MSAERGHPNDSDEIRRKLERDARCMTGSEREELRTVIDTALDRLTPPEDPLAEAAEA